MKNIVVSTLVLCITCFIYVNSQETDKPILTTPLGNIQGTTLTSRLGKKIYSFRGIRYAKAPVNELRFQPPVPVDEWEGIYNATQDGPSCPQPGLDPISEDCLMANVYTRKLPSRRQNPKTPVIVYLHPGGFYSSTTASLWAGPQYFMDQNIVFVTFNYRVGTLGFLSTGDKEAPGNNGLKDQVILLKWVQRNIASFGGDPDKVTLMGYSAGAWSIVLHMVSPMSKGLFHQAISMSGSPLGQWPIPENGQLNIAKKQARFVGCPENDTTTNIVKCLKKVPYQDFANTLVDFREFGQNLLLVWSPVVEPDVGQPRFLHDHPIRLITSGQFQHVPFITGRTSDEFSFFVLDVLGNETLTEELNNNFEKVAPIAFAYERDTNFSREVSRNLKQFFFQNKPIDKSQEQNLKDLYEDLVGFQSHRAAKLLAQYNTQPVYYYRFSYQGRYSHVYQPGMNNTVPYGVVHHDDLIYLFYISPLFPWFDETAPEAEVVTKLTTIYANFAIYGNPTPQPSKTLNNVKWPCYTLRDQKYLDMGQQFVVKERLNERRFREWEKLFPISMYLKNSP